MRIASPEYKGVVVDTRYVPSNALLTNVEGSAWTVDYFSQVLDTDSALSGQDVTLSAIYQQYRLIKGFEFKVTSPLATSQDDVAKTMTLTGTATIFPFLIPNVGDMFFADIGDGREGIFRVTSSERRAIFKDTCHVIEYQLIDYSTELRRGDLLSKVVQTLYFVKDFLLHGQNPLLEEAEAQNVKKLTEWYFELANTYFKAFVSNEFKTLLLPGQPHPTYDAFLTKAATSILTTWDVPQLRFVRRLNVDGDDGMKTSTLWDALLQKDPHVLRVAMQRIGLVFAQSFEDNPMMEGIYWSGVTYVVYPKDPELFVDYDYRPAVKYTLDTVSIQPLATRLRSLNDLLTTNTLNGLPYDGAPMIHPVLVDDHYVFSQAFYDQVSPGQSRLELCVRDYLDGKALSTPLLLALCETAHAWGGLERFYYIPILLILIKAAVRSL